MNKINKINIIGAGNVGVNLGLHLYNNNIKIVNVYSKTLKNAVHLADKIKANAIDNIELISDKVDLNIVCIKDDYIYNIIKKLPLKIPIVHTSGSVNIDIMNKFNYYGSLYPLQTFSKKRIIKVNEVPFFIETNNFIFQTTIDFFCRNHLSKNIHLTNSKQREVIHLAAVISSNFTTQLLSESQLILNKSNLPLNILKPLMIETINKSFELSPNQALTGPAIRNDNETMIKQIEMIQDIRLKELYIILSERINKLKI